VRGINERLDKEAVKAVKSLKKFKPARNAGLPVKVRYMMPIRLKIQ
jgi:outer membrane biosynthesis protein TonB